MTNIPELGMHKTIVFCFAFLLMLVLATSIALLGGCASGSTQVISAPKADRSFTAYTVVEQKSEVLMPDLAKAQFVDALDAEMKRDDAFVEGPGLEMDYRFIAYDAGNAFGRWFWLGIGNAGEGTLSVEVTFRDERGEPLAAIKTSGGTRSGPMSSGIEQAIASTAKEVAVYARQHFLKHAPSQSQNAPIREPSNDSRDSQ